MIILVVAVVFFLIAKKIRRMAFTILSYEESVIVVEEFTSLRKFVTLFFIGYILLYLALRMTSLSDGLQLIIHTFCFAILSAVFIAINAYKLTKIRVDPAFIRMFLLSRAISLTGTGLSAYMLFLVI